MAAENAKLNGVGELIDIWRKVWTFRLQEKAPYDLIVANIVANPLIALSVEIAGALAVTGRIMVSGIHRDRAEEVAASYAENGLRLTGRIKWVTGQH